MKCSLMVLISNTSFNEFHIDYPSYFTTSSLYFHISEKGRFAIERSVYKGLEKDIPVVSYTEKKNSSGSNAKNAGVSSRIRS